LLRVNEIFYSIQGESSYAGRPCLFIRLTGCNLRCSYCDTQYAYYEGAEMSVADILQRAQSINCRLAEVTGGEPLLQDEAPELIEGLLDSGWTVLLETNGSKDISRVDRRCIKIVDFKCPSSGEAGSNDFANIDRLQDHDEVKCVIGNRHDYEFACNIYYAVRQNPECRSSVLFSPVFDWLAPEKLAEWVLADQLKVRLNLQLHKYIWDPTQRGV